MAGKSVLFAKFAEWQGASMQILQT